LSRDTGESSFPLISVENATMLNNVPRRAVAGAILCALMSSYGCGGGSQPADDPVVNEKKREEYGAEYQKKMMEMGKMKAPKEQK
jgi:hypothetical protein